MQTENTIDVKNLCSAKLLELLRRDLDRKLNPLQKASVEHELLARKHYLPELASLHSQTTH